MKLSRVKIYSRRSGISRLDVIVVLCVMAVLFAVIAPATNQGRGPARKLGCLSNMKIVSLAVQNFVAGSDGNLPFLTSDIDVVKNGDGPNRIIRGSWPMVLLPALDSTALLKNIKRNAVVEPGATDPIIMTIAETERVWLPAFTCPDDVDSFRKPGGLSFVVNGGFISRSIYSGDPDGLHRPGMMSWDGNSIIDETTDINIGAATGVFWRKNGSFQSSLDYISSGDGQSTTIMVTENIHAGLWFDTDTAKIAFVLPVVANGGQVQFGNGNVFESTERPLNTMFNGGTLATAMPKDWQINSDLKATVGTRPRPSSNHKGGVNIMMCDGSGRFLSEQVDPHVYVKLLTANGMTYGETRLPESSY